MAFWTDESADAVERRHAAPFVVSDWKTPSGHIHVGSLRGVLVHDAVARALRSRGHDVVYYYGFDDADPFDKIPNYLDQAAYTPYLGRPMRELPVPDEQGKPDGQPVTLDHNYARFYAEEFEVVYRQLGVDSVTLYKATLYDEGRFNEAIRLILDQADDVTAAFEAVVVNRTEDRAGKALVAKFPINVRCEQCGKVATTVVTAWDGTNVQYQCRTGTVPWAEGCGHEGAVSPFDGRAKLPWKLDWPGSWFVLQSDIEGAGKDHYTKGGSRDVGVEVFKRIFAPAAKAGYQQPPEDLFYEWLYDEGGKKLSTSKAVGARAADMLKELPPELFRFLVVRTRPASGVEFRHTALTVPQLADEFDRIVREAAAGDDVATRLLHATRLLPDTPLVPAPLKFSTVSSLVQLPQVSVQEWAAQELGRPLTAEEQDVLAARVAAAAAWLTRFPSERLYTLQTETPTLSLSESERSFIEALAASLDSLAHWDGATVQDAIYAAANGAGLPTKQGFVVLYRLFVGQDSGPRAGFLLAQLGKQMVLERLRAVL